MIKIRRNKKLGNYIILFIVVFSFSFQPQKKEFEEYSVKASFVLNFTKFIDWQSNPIERSKTFNIGVLGYSPIQKQLIEITGVKKINNIPFEISTFSDPENFIDCKILFIPANTPSRLTKECSTIPNLKNTLIITEKKGALKDGSAINFLIIDNRIKFEINTNSLNKANLKASSQLLKLAQKIEEL